jgi:hypothetical protein
VKLKNKEKMAMLLGLPPLAIGNVLAEISSRSMDGHAMNPSNSFAFFPI